MPANAQVLPDPSFSVRTEEDGDALVVRASGDLDLVAAERFGLELMWALTGDASAVFVDLSGVEFIDSTGLRALLEASKLSSQNGGKLRIGREVSPAAERLLEITGVGDTLPFDD
jgi:anti-sigma B factor antagonist